LGLKSAFFGRTTPIRAAQDKTLPPF